MQKIGLVVAVLAVLGSSALMTYLTQTRYQIEAEANTPLVDLFAQTNSDVEGVTTSKLPSKYIIPMRYHTFQTFNNCGPSSLAMALSYFGINKTQAELGEQLRPYQVASGDNDDKSVTFEEMAAKAEEYGLVAYHRPNGDIELLQKFIAIDIPVITKTWTKKDDDIGHFRLVRGYTENKIVQDDSYNGKNISYSNADFMELWEKFSYEYLVLVPQDKVSQAEAIMGENVDPKVAWTNAVNEAQIKLSQNPDNIYERFNLSVAYYNIGEYQKSVDEFEKVEHKLPFRTLWYQIEPVQAYFELGQYDRVFEITDHILNNNNRAYSEAYIIRGDIYKIQDNLELARQEYEKAVFYNKNLVAAKQRLDMLN